MASDGPPPVSTSLNPNMVYRAVTPPADRYGDLGEPSKKFRFHAIAYLRSIVVLFSIAGLALWIVHNPGRHVCSVLSFILIWIILFYNLFVGLHKKRGDKKHGTGLHCQIGIFQCSCGASDDEDITRFRDEGDDDDSQPPNRRLRLLWLVDLAFGIELLVLVIILCATLRRWTLGQIIPPVVFTYCIAISEIAIALLSNFKAFRPATIHLYSDEDNHHTYRIRLPQDRVPRSLHRDRNVSIQA